MLANPETCVVYVCVCVSCVFVDVLTVAIVNQNTQEVENERFLMWKTHTQNEHIFGI